MMIGTIGFSIAISLFFMRFLYNLYDQYVVQDARNNIDYVVSMKVTLLL
jgi:hypothetical protein